ncbi:MAG: helix-turn-helix transcriptional regulator [Actinomycetota bacterium]
MVENRHEAPIVEVGYRSRIDGLPVEILDLADTRSRLMLVVERLSFHLMIWCLDGRGTHQVDFDDIELGPRRVLLLRPGQVHRWQADGAYDARMLLFEGSPTLDDDGWFPGRSAAVVFDLDEEHWAAGMRTLDEIAWEQERFDPEGSVPVLSALRDVAVARVLRWGPSSSAGRLPRPYVEFREAIEEHLGEHREVVSYAELLGYSARTIDRACRAAVGLGAKRVLDERVALEARRSLAHSTAPVEVIGRSLGFTEATNFTKFFRRVMGVTPSEFRTATA